MDKYEYKVRSEEIKALIARKEYAEAVKIADTIDWRRVRSVMMLCTISDLYKINRRLEDSKNILLMAYDRHPTGRNILYSLCELCIKTEDIVGAVEYYKQYVQAAPKDTGRYILQYKLYEAQDVSLEERIAVLEEFKKRDYREKWGYELAYLYHRMGLAAKCVEECDDLILWFGEGKYVIKAMELKMLHEHLTKEQQEKYNRRYEKNIESSLTRVLPTVQINEQLDAAKAQEISEKEREILEAPTMRLPLEEIDIQVKMVDVGQYNTINIQRELAESMKEILPNGVEPDPELRMDEPTNEIPGTEDAIPVQEEPEQISPEELEAWNHAVSPAFTFYDHKQEDLEQELSTWNEAPSAAFTFYDPKTGVTAVLSAKEQAELAKELAAWDRAGSAAFTFYDAKTGTTGSLSAEEQEKLAQELAAWNQVPSAAFTFYDFKGEAQRVEQANAQSTAWQQESPNQDSVDPYDIAGQMRASVPENGMSEVFFGETGEICLQGDTAATVMEQMKEQVVAYQSGQMPPFPSLISPQALPSQPLDKILSMEDDGQLKIVVPDAATIEKQITGQLSIEDILAEWEKMKAQSQEKCMEAVKERVKRQTGNMFAEFDEATKNGLLEQLEELANGTLEDASQITAYAGEALEEETYAPTEEDTYAPAEEILEEDTYAPAEEIPEEDIYAPAEEISEEDTYAPAEEIPEEDTYAPAEEILEEDTYAPTEEVFYQEEAAQEDIISENGIIEEEIPEEEIPEEENEVFFQDGNTGEIPDQDIREVVETAEPDMEDMDAEENSEIGNFFTERIPVEEIQEEPKSFTEQLVAEIYFDDPGEKATGEEKIKCALEEEASVENTAKEKAKVRDLTREERELFAAFVQDRATKEQLIGAIESITLASYTGNVIVTGEEAETTFALAKNLVRNLQMSDANFSGKIAKISGEGLNKKDVADTISKVENGALLIQNAGAINEDTAQKLAKALEKENSGIVIVLEDTKKSINRLIEKNPMLLDIFNARIDIKAMDNDSLVDYAKKYAYEREYAIDEMAILALHTRIADMQTLDHAVTVAEVKEIMDEAIAKASRKNISHFFDIVLNKRFDEEDMIVIREKDFI